VSTTCMVPAPGPANLIYSSPWVLGSPPNI
jgi:hypothetical protein